MFNILWPVQFMDWGLVTSVKGTEDFTFVFIDLYKNKKSHLQKIKSYQHKTSQGKYHYSTGHTDSCFLMLCENNTSYCQISIGKKNLILHQPESEKNNNSKIHCSLLPVGKNTLKLICHLWIFPRSWQERIWCGGHTCIQKENRNIRHHYQMPRFDNKTLQMSVSR